MNKKIIITSIAFLAVAAIGYFAYPSFTSQQELKKYAWEEGNDTDELPKELRIREQLLYNAEITKDEALGYPPVERLATAIAQTRRLQEQYYGANSTGSREGLEDARWKERGPNNVGGRTRTILIDESDPERKKIWAGSVSGGLWYTNDISASNPSWQKVNDYMDNLSIGAMAQDPQSPNKMYLGTGEGYTGIAGFGLYRSTDGGATWELIPSTASGTTQNFIYTQGMIVHPETGDVYVATSTGLYRSQNGGDSWQKVLSTSQGANSNYFYDVHYEGGKVWACTQSRIYKTDTGNAGEWEGLGFGFNNFPTGWQRCEFDVCHSDPNILYAIGNSGGGASKVYRSSNGGETWIATTKPVNSDGSEFTNGQVWYDLDIAINPYDCSHFIVGGVSIMQSFNAGLSIGQQEQANGSPSGHPDHHAIVFDDEIPGRVLHGTDGGIYVRDNFQIHNVTDKNQNYNVTQYYCAAIHPEEYSNYMIGGTQDNGSHSLSSYGTGAARYVWGGDGMFCHIDQDDGMIQIVSSQFGNYGISTNGGNSFSNGVSVDGGFVNISDYDDESNILYAQTNKSGGDLYRHKIDGSISEVFDAGIGSIYAIHCDPNVSNRIYIGSSGGKVFRIDDAHQGASVNAVQLAQFGGSILSIDVEIGNPDHLLVTKGNYGVSNNIYESKDGGETWIGVEGTAVPNNLPDVPVRWGVFHPEDGTKAMIATEVGVWGTELLDGENTVWLPPVPGVGTPLVRTSMLQVRRSDNFVLAATYGRGLFTTDVWAAPKAILSTQGVSYLGGRVLMSGSSSVNATSFEWDLGDGTTSTEQDFYHSYGNLGTYDISLTLNGEPNNPDLNASKSIVILPSHSLPYTEEGEEYSGSFEGFEEQWAVDNVGGNSTWERGNSTQLFKNGTISGNNAFVIAKDEQYYEQNSESYLYLPNFDFSEPTIYEFSFHTRYKTAPGRDGFNVQYSLNKGETWQVLGNGSNFYNYANDDGSSGTSFPLGQPFFTGELAAYTQFKLNVTDLFSGQENVAFRFVFRSGEGLGNYPGVMIDDVKITKFEGEAKTKITQQSLEFDTDPNPDELVVKWSTRPEYYARKFEIYSSVDGFEFTKVASKSATGIVSSTPKNYTERINGNRNFYFVQIYGISENEELGIQDTIKMPVMVANKNGAEDVTLFSTDPNPFISNINLTFTDYVVDNVKLELFDVAGRLLYTEDRAMDGFTTTFVAPNLATGHYVLRYTIGSQEPKLFYILKASN